MRARRTGSLSQARPLLTRYACVWPAAQGGQGGINAAMAMLTDFEQQAEMEQQEQRHSAMVAKQVRPPGGVRRPASYRTAATAALQALHALGRPGASAGTTCA